MGHVSTGLIQLRSQFSALFSVTVGVGSKFSIRLPSSSKRHALSRVRSSILPPGPPRAMKRRCICCMCCRPGRYRRSTCRAKSDSGALDPAEPIGDTRAAGEAGDGAGPRARRGEARRERRPGARPSRLQLRARGPRREAAGADGAAPDARDQGAHHQTADARAPIRAHGPTLRNCGRREWRQSRRFADGWAGVGAAAQLP